MITLPKNYRSDTRNSFILDRNNEKVFVPNEKKK